MAVIGGILSSTLLTLVVVPAAFSYIDRFRLWSGGVMKRLAGLDSVGGNGHAKSAKRSAGHREDQIETRPAV